MTPQRAADLVPHAGAMCLLDEVVDWQADCIHCRSRLGPTHEHPLAGRGGLPATGLIEYAAQATAAHGTLVARADEAGRSEPTAGGRLVALRDIELKATRADIAAVTVVDIHAQRLMADATGSIYVFRVIADQHTLVSGRITIRCATQ